MTCSNFPYFSWPFKPFYVLCQIVQFCDKFISHGLQFDWIISTLKKYSRRIFGSKKEEVVGGWRCLSEELHYVYVSSSIIRGVVI